MVINESNLIKSNLKGKVLKQLQIKILNKQNSLEEININSSYP